MKLYKKELNKLCKVVWKDARYETGITLREMIKKEFEVNTSVGWLRHFTKEYVIISAEYSLYSEGEDFTLVPIEWITELEMLEK